MIKIARTVLYTHAGGIYLIGYTFFQEIFEHVEIGAVLVLDNFQKPLLLDLCDLEHVWFLLEKLLLTMIDEFSNEFKDYTL